MRFFLASDLHTEFFTDGGKALISTFDSTGVDGIILAGDCLTATTPHITDRFFQLVAERGYKHRIFVPGNHEYYRSSLEAAHNRLRTAATKHGFYFLEPGKQLLLEGRRFLGGTMWFPFKPLNLQYQAGMTDFHVIGGFVPQVYKWNEDFLAFIEANPRRGDVVVTHHLPSFKSVPEKYKGSALNNFFVCNLEKLIALRQPKLWVHGHTHTGCDYQIGATRVLANPRGYPGSKEIKVWNSNCIVEV